MEFEIKIEDRADREMLEAIDYYASLNVSGLVERFLSDYRRTLNQLKTNPFFPVEIDAIRAIPFKIFPYVLFFKIFESEGIILIVSVFTTFQDPIKYPA